MQLLANYRQTALEQIQALSALSQADITAQPPSTEEIWVIKILIATLAVLMWWAILED
jgi:hypothetical protein